MLTIANASIRLTRSLLESEEAINNALERHASLLHAATLALNTGIDVDPVRSHSTLMHLQKTIGELTSARSNTIRVHGELLEFAKELGMTEEKDCPDWKTAVKVDETKAA